MAAVCSNMKWLVASVLLLSVLATCLTSVVAVECFVCSYAPRSNSSRIDGCTESNFTDVVIDTRHCDIGCERVAVYDVNGELESYHRNCAHEETSLTNTCETHETLALTKIVCACDYSYCNGGSGRRTPPFTAAIALLTLFVLCVGQTITRIGGNPHGVTTSIP